MKPKKILWPTDFSKDSLEALSYIKNLSRDNNTEIHILYVIEDIPHHEPWYGEYSSAHVHDFSKRIGETAEKRLNQICDKYLEGCPLFIRHTATGQPATEILKFIENEGMDQVVMTHRETPPERVLSPQIFQTVFENSMVPVKTVRIYDRH